MKTECSVLELFFRYGIDESISYDWCTTLVCESKPTEDCFIMNLNSWFEFSFIWILEVRFIHIELHRIAFVGNGFSSAVYIDCNLQSQQHLVDCSNKTRIKSLPSKEKNKQTHRLNKFTFCLRACAVLHRNNHTVKSYFIKVYEWNSIMLRLR